MPEKMTQSTKRNVKWQTSSQYRRLAIPSDRTLNYVWFARKIQIPEIFVSSLVQCNYNSHFGIPHVLQ